MLQPTNRAAVEVRVALTLLLGCGARNLCQRTATGEGNN